MSLVEIDWYCKDSEWPVSTKCATNGLWSQIRVRIDCLLTPTNIFSHLHLITYTFSELAQFV